MSPKGLLSPSGLRAVVSVEAIRISAPAGTQMRTRSKNEDSRFRTFTPKQATGGREMILRYDTLFRDSVELMVVRYKEEVELVECQQANIMEDVRMGLQSLWIWGQYWSSSRLAICDRMW